ncbi:toprim domain-containing protein [Heliobacterium chlorum]|uniref:Toprim domain-containing protein n=1 Tax=Heliobacterium chlorum TaxID=2698 RepID=A0ABR7T6L3_HELCL|nr:toprim domain-containing protein [Heliobacterium chlorum]MBC9786393.1 toprim domain-containing protein [Heliobacterium chlorum]
MITVRGFELPVNIQAEIEQYDWKHPKWTEKNFIACSPFRDERHPSFAVHLSHGVWLDSGADNPDWNKGNFVTLMAYLRNETYGETEEYLLNKYGTCIPNPDDLILLVDLTEKKKPGRLDQAILRKYLFRHPYLENVRGIGEKYQQVFQIGYDKKSRAITFPWFDKKGQLVNIKYRSIHGKMFWYYSGGQPVKDHLYGLNAVYRLKTAEAFIVESEIDAITLWQAGCPAVALGGANLSQQQRKLLIQSPIERLIIATDNDKAGERIAQSISENLGGYLLLEAIRLPENVKDVNELPPDELLSVISHPFSLKYVRIFS